MVDMLKTTEEDVQKNIEEMCEGKSDAQIVDWMAKLKDALGEAKVDVISYKYQLGVELAAGQYTKLAAEKPSVVLKFPAVSRKVPKVIVKPDGTIETKETLRYTNPTPIGRGDLPLSDLTDVDALRKHTELPAEDLLALQKLQDAVDNAEDVADMRKALTALDSKERELLKSHKIAGKLYITRVDLNDVAVVKAESRLDKANANSRFLQWKISALQSVLSQRAETKVIARARKNAEWMNESGRSLVEKELAN